MEKSLKKINSKKMRIILYLIFYLSSLKLCISQNISIDEVLHFFNDSITVLPEFKEKYFIIKNTEPQEVTVLSFAKNCLGKQYFSSNYTNINYENGNSLCLSSYKNVRKRNKLLKKKDSYKMIIGEAYLADNYIISSIMLFHNKYEYGFNVYFLFDLNHERIKYCYISWVN